MIEIKNIHKSFGKLPILKGINLKIEEGKVYAFLGPNGSGKTTLLKCILGLVKADSGEILIKGKSIEKDWKYRSQIGYMPQIANFPENLKVKELFRMIKDIRKSNVDESPFIHHFNLDDALDKKLKNLSGGMKQKVNAILTLMFDANIFIMDEPSVGLDPISHLKLKNKIRNKRKEGKTVLLTSHILSDVEELADEIIFLLDGKIIFQGSPDELLISQDEKRIDNAIAKLTDREAYTKVNNKSKKEEVVNI